MTGRGKKREESSRLLSKKQMRQGKNHHSVNCSARKEIAPGKGKEWEEKNDDRPRREEKGPRSNRLITGGVQEKGQTNAGKSEQRKRRNERNPTGLVSVKEKESVETREQILTRGGSYVGATGKIDEIVGKV